LRPARRGGRLLAVAQLADTARFRPEDPDVLVSASLACPVCLRDEHVSWHGALDGHDPSVECRCPECRARWRVYLEPLQALRLGLLAERPR
jgi:hypothetical protein